MRICGRSAINTLRLEDAISGSTLEINYRMPTTTERQEYMNAQVRKEDGEVISDVVAARVKFGLQIMTGFRPGDFGREENGKIMPMAAEEGHEHYCANWRDVLADGAQDVLMRLAAQVFDVPVSQAKRERAEKN